ncbi:MAG: trypsin-like peptidase domain-containing protein [Planctomycetaceae bacterium]
MYFFSQRLVAIVLLTASVATAADSTPATSSDNDPRRTPLVRAVQQCQSSVVNIHTEKNGVDEGDSRFFTPKPRRISGMGTGIVVDERGYILTNYHVIHEVDVITVTLKNGETLSGTPVSFDRKKDMAIIRVNASTPLSVMEIGTSSDVMLAEQVFAVGNAFGYEHTVTAGIVSALGRDVEVDETQSYENLIQTDASINPGNSGGPLLNLRGELIGVNVAIRAGAQRIGFAIPIDDARKTVARLLSTERLNRLSHGVFATDVKKPDDHRLVIDQITDGSPAALCGLQQGDVIRTVRGITVHDNADWERGLLDIPSGQVVNVEVDRAGQSLSLPFTVGSGTSVAAASPPKDHPSVPVQTVSSSAVRSPAGTLSAIRQRALDVFGLQLTELSPRDVQLIKGRYRGGLMVQQVTKGSLAEQQGIRSGDMLLGLDGFETLDDHSLTFILDQPRLKTLTDLKFTIFRQNEALEGFMPLTKRTR